MNQSVFEVQAQFCKAMGSAVRLRMLHALRGHPLTANEISREIDVPQSTVSRQLTVLRRIGVVVSRQRENARVYQISDDKIGEICDLVREILVEQARKRSLLVE